MQAARVQPPSRRCSKSGASLSSVLASALDERRARGLPVFDFIQANPQEYGFEFPNDLLREIIAEACRAARFYRPDSRGQLPAREAVAAFHGDGVGPEAIVLTPGTSMAYWYCFRLLARSGGEVLCPAPTYPLFDDLARLAGLRTRSYHLDREDDGCWRIDPAEVEFQITRHTCAIVVVSPHNPTGMVASAGELQALAAIGARHGLPLIFDEVFREFLHTADCVPRPGECGAPLSITLNGLSKMLSLPGLKAGWMVVEGADRALVRRFLAALEYAADTFLPVSEIVQGALPRLLAPPSIGYARTFARLYCERMSALIEAWRAAGLPLAMPQAGVYLPVPLPEKTASDEEIALRLLRESGIYCHAGSSYAMPFPSLITMCVPAPPWPVGEMAELVRGD